MERTLFPNATQFPDVLTDQIMPLVSGNEWKVIHYGVRYALGHRSADTLTISQFAHGRQDQEGNWIDRGTGLAEAEVKECLAFLCEVVHIFLREDRPRKPLGYRLNLDLSSINWALLEQRQSTAQAEPPPPEPVQQPTAAPAPAAVARPARRKAPAIFVELPITEVRLDDGSDRPVLDKLGEKMDPAERQTFEHLLALAREHRMGEDDAIVWPIYRLWKTYGFRRLQNAFQSPVPLASLADVNQSCLVGAVTEMLDTERFGPITPTFRDQVIEMARDWPNLIDWQDALAIAVRLNKRRLQTVETILKNKNAPPAPASQGDRHNGGSTTSAQGRRRTSRRQSQFADEELKAIRDAEDDGDWSPAPR